MGFRALAYIEQGQCRLVSRHGHTYKGFDPLKAALVRELAVKDAILDGEIVCLDAKGKSLFNTLLFRRGSPIFAAFDLLWMNGEDLRSLPLMERKQRLRQIVPHASSHVLHVDYLPERGQELFQLACQNDLEGIVGEVGTGHLPGRWKVNELGQGQEPERLAGRGASGFVEGKGRGRRTAHPS